MLRNLSALLAGGLFGAGLLVSGMVDTAKVQGWLDVFGAWDPTLAFVLSGAVAPMALVWRFAARRERSYLGLPMPRDLPVLLERNLVLGSLLFGAGWGIIGFCPGPAVASLSFGGWQVWAFVAAMIAGMAASPALRRKLDLLDRPSDG